MIDDPTVRDQVLTAAVDAASIHGIAKLSMADVARLAGLSRQTVYRHFPSKDALVAEVIASETAHLADGVIAATPGYYASNLIDAVDNTALAFGGSSAGNADGIRHFVHSVLGDVPFFGLDFLQKRDEVLFTELLMTRNDLVHVTHTAYLGCCTDWMGGMGSLFGGRRTGELASGGGDLVGLG